MHPDAEAGSQDKFIAIQEAYKILSDPSKRKIYDKSLGIEYSTW